MKRNMKAVKGNKEVSVVMTESVLAQTVLNGASVVCGKKIASVPVSLLRIDESYQREPKSDSIQNLVNEWDMNSCDFLDVSYRDGKFYIIDGQHRYTAAKYIGVQTLPCVIRTGLVRSQEAIIFARQNRNTKKLYPYDTYKANIICGDESIKEVKIDVEINRICVSHNIVVKKVSKDTKKDSKILRSLSTARDIVDVNGVDCFEWIIDTICKTNWENCSVSYSKSIMAMLKNFYIENKDNITDHEASVMKVMNGNTPMQLIARSRADYSEYALQTGLNICFKKLVESPKIKTVKVVGAS